MGLSNSDAWVSSTTNLPPTETDPGERSQSEWELYSAHTAGPHVDEIDAKQNLSVERSGNFDLPVLLQGVRRLGAHHAGSLVGGGDFAPGHL